MKKVFVTVAVAITVISILVGILGASAVVYARKNIDFDIDEALFEKAKEDQTVYYYAYENGELVEVYKSSRDTVREWVDIDEVCDSLKQGFLAMEDREFYKHNGVNFKRTLAAAVNHVLKLRSTFGASTITQQVIKNVSGDNETSIARKIKEIFRALSLERNHTKDDIFEMYLNVIPMSGRIYGVSAAAEIYFNKEASDLSVAEAATIVGITNAPSKYNPYVNSEACREKRDRVLYAMHSVGYISDEEYDVALKTPLVISEKSGNYGISSWFIETANEDILNDIVSTYHLSLGAARLMLNGSSVILTLNPTVQNILEEFFKDNGNLSDKVSGGLSYSMVVTDPYSGNLLGIVGNNGKKSAEKLFNYATAPVTPGSVLKPLGLYAPLIEEGSISWSTMLLDEPVEYHESGEMSVPYPRNTPDVYDGKIDLNDALRKSKNTVAVRLYNMLGAERIIAHLQNDYGFNTVVKSGIGVNGEQVSDIGSAPLALGQLSYGIPLRKLTEAYTVFPNEGVISSGRSYFKVYSQGGELILNRDLSQKRIYSKETAEVMNQLLSSVVADGTARQIKLKELVDVAGKTGTSGNDRDRLFLGYTPYFVAGIWCGFSGADKAVGQNDPSHVQIWDEVMRRIHDRIVFTGYDETLKAFSTDKLIVLPYCSESGMTPTEYCELDDNASIKHGYFKASDFKKEKCDYHIKYLQPDDSVL